MGLKDFAHCFTTILFGHCDPEVEFARHTVTVVAINK